MRLKKILFEFLGLSIILGGFVVILIITTSFILYGGIILYENNLVIAIFEVICNYLTSESKMEKIKDFRKCSEIKYIKV